MPVKFKLALPMALLVVLMAAPSATAVDPVVDPPPDPISVNVMPTGLPGLVVVISTDTNGYLTSVDLLSGEPAGVAPGYLATRVDNRRVRFENSETGTRVEVEAKKDKLKTKVRTGTFAELLGTHTWSGPVLGEPTTVTFTVGDDGTGAPTLADIVVSPGPAEISGPETKVEDHEIEAEVKIRFTNNLGQRADLKIEVEVHDDDEHGASSASLKIDLKTKDEKMRVPTADLISLPSSWAGVLCDGSPASVTWVNNADGSMTDLVVTPDSAEVKQSDHEFKVRFGHDAKLKVSLEVGGDDTFDMKVDPKIKCKNGPDPAVNTPVDEKHHEDKKHHED